MMCFTNHITLDDDDDDDAAPSITNSDNFSFRWKMLQISATIGSMQLKHMQVEAKRTAILRVQPFARFI